MPKYKTEILNESFTKDIESEIQAIILSRQMTSKMTGGKLIRHCILGTRDTSTSNLIAVSFAVCRVVPSLKAPYYHYGVCSMTGHAHRPPLLLQTFNYLKENNKKNANGLAVNIQNPRIKDCLLSNYGFISDCHAANSRLFYRNFT